MYPILTATEVDALIKRITDHMANCCYRGMTGEHHNFVIRASNDLQVISNLLSRSMPLRRDEWGDKYV
jgi:hypothetical protein